MKRVLLAGATGYLGGYIAKELHEKGFFVRAVVRSGSKLQEKGTGVNETVEAELTRPETLENCCEGIDAVISTVGITRQKDGLTYMVAPEYGKYTLKRYFTDLNGMKG